MIVLRTLKKALRRSPLLLPAVVIIVMSVLFAHPHSKYYRKYRSLPPITKVVTLTQGGGLVGAMTLGDRSHLQRSVRQQFSAVGASHVLALSGLHLSILYFFLSFVFYPFRRRLFFNVILLSSIWVYAYAVGMSASITRAAIMLSLITLSTMMLRKASPVNNLSLSAILILLFSPSSVYDIGFQLSFAAVLFIIILYKPLFRLMPFRLRRNRFVAFVWSMVCISFVAQMGTAPLVAHYFHIFPVYFLLSNFVVVPAAYIIIGGTIIYLLHVFPATVSMLLDTVVDTMLHLVRLIASLPGATVTGISFSWLQVLCAYLIILFTTSCFLMKLQK